MTIPQDGRTAGRQVVAILERAGVPRPRWEARQLGALGEGACAAAERRAAGEPLAYVLGSAGFRMLDLMVDDRVLIPRPETEGLVERVLAWQATVGNGGRAVDVGTGSGCIALSLAVEGAFDDVLAVDVSEDALAVARANAARVRPATPVTWQRGDLLVGVEGPLHVVVSNPPYVTAEEWDDLDASVRDHEPRLALVAADGGMALIARLAREAFACLVPGGLLAMEVDSRRADAAADGARVAGFRNARIEDDLYGRPRYLMATKE